MSKMHIWFIFKIFRFVVSDYFGNVSQLENYELRQVYDSLSTFIHSLTFIIFTNKL